MGEATFCRSAGLLSKGSDGLEPGAGQTLYFSRTFIHGAYGIATNEGENSHHSNTGLSFM